MPMVLLLAVLSPLIACQPRHVVITTDDSRNTDADADADTDTDLPISSYACDELPEFNLRDLTLENARANHGLTFDDAGSLIGWDGRASLVKSRYDGTMNLWVPGMTGVEQIDRLPDGTAVVVDRGAGRIARVTDAGALETLASDVGRVYGLTTGPDGKLYVTNGNIVRIDPATGESSTLVVPNGTYSFHAVNFNLDSTRMYLGTSYGVGDVYYVDLDEDLNPITEPQIYASRVGSGWQDGIELDTCGNVYVAEYYTFGLYRISAGDRRVTRLTEPTTTNLYYGHGLVWGSGIDGWREDTLYQPQPYNDSKVREVVIGARSGDTVRTWRGVPAPW